MSTNDFASPATFFPRATIELRESEIPAILKAFRAFVGEERLERRIQLADKMIASASPAYRDCFVRPKQSLWLGTRELLRLVKGGRLGREPLTPAAVLSLHHMASIRNVAHTMPSWKKAEFRSRLTDKGGGDIAALIEIAAASRAVTLGGGLKWVPEKDGARAFEMLVSYKGQKLEIECTAKPDPRAAAFFSYPSTDQLDPSERSGRVGRPSKKGSVYCLLSKSLRKGS